MKTLKIIFFLSLLILGKSKFVHCKHPDIPPSPDASIFGQFINSPIGLHTGTNSISFSLHPGISVAYHSSGIKPGQPEGILGPGWLLDVGGIITRVVRNLPDECTKGWLNYGDDIPLSDLGSEDISMLNQLASGVVDDQPDIFFFSFSGYSGKFVFDNEQNIQLIPYQDISIVRQSDTSFVITTPNGVKYTFGKDNASRVYNNVEIYKSEPPINTSGTKRTIAEYISEWHLSSIESPNTTDIRTFEYFHLKDTTEIFCDNYIISGYGDFEPNAGIYTEWGEFYIPFENKEVSTCIYKTYTPIRLAGIKDSTNNILFHYTEDSMKLERIIFDIEKFEYFNKTTNTLNPQVKNL